MLYLAENKKPLVLPVLAIAVGGGFLILVASYAFHLDGLSYVFESADARMWFSWAGSLHMFGNVSNAGMTIAAISAAALYIFHRRSRYFGNTTPLIVALILLSLETTGVRSEPWIWALPFRFDLHRRGVCRHAGVAPQAHVPMVDGGLGGDPGYPHSGQFAAAGFIGVSPRKSIVKAS